MIERPKSQNMSDACSGLFKASPCLLLEQALIDDNKDFDMPVFPRAGHPLPSYGKRREWDYFVENLAGEAPPHEFPLKTDSDNGFRGSASP